MTGGADLRQHRHAEAGRVGHEFREFGTGVVAGVRAAVEAVAARRADHRLGAAAADLGQPGIRGDRHPPALVVGEVEVEHVELVQRQQVDVAAQVVGGLEVAGHVEHGAAPGVAGDVGDLHAGQFPAHGTPGRVGQGLVREELAHRLDSAQESRRPGRSQQHPAAAHRQAVPLVPEAAEAGVERQDEGAVVGVIQTQSGRGSQGGPQERGRGLGSGGDAQACGVVEPEAAGTRGHLAGTGDQGAFGTRQVHEDASPVAVSLVRDGRVAVSLVRDGGGGMGERGGERGACRPVSP
ncbi:hypothetical protein GCM10019017_24360 [Streptomyces showdoensis]